MSLAAVCAMGVLGALASLYLKELRPELARLLALGTGVVIMAAVLPMAAEFVEGIRGFSQLDLYAGSFLGPLLKITGIAYIAQFAAELCRDAGENALAGRVEFAGKTAISLMSFPIIKEVFMSLMSLIESG